MLVTRRTILRQLAIASLLAGCRQGKDRCAYCGMRISPTSAWRADLELTDGTTRHFDTPSCGLRAWRSGRFNAKSIRVIEYYERVWRDGNEVLFVVGSDVTGPMGPEVVPINPKLAQKFADDHTSGRPLSLQMITLELLADLR